MYFLNKFRIFFAVSLFILIIFRIVIPGYKELKRERKVTEKDVHDYVMNSVIINISNYEIYNQSSEVYMDGAPFIKHHSIKNVVYIKDLDTQKIYKLELFHRQSLYLYSDGQKATLSLVVNEKEINKGEGSNRPVIALRYTFADKAIDNYVLDNQYIFSVSEYLIYKNYIPLTSNHLSYYLVLFWTVITIGGFVTTTAILTKKGYMNEQGNFKFKEPLNKDVD